MYRVSNSLNKFIKTTLQHKFNTNPSHYKLIHNSFYINYSDFTRKAKSDNTYNDDNHNNETVISPASKESHIVLGLSSIDNCDITENSNYAQVLNSAEKSTLSNNYPVENLYSSSSDVDDATDSGLTANPNNDNKIHNSMMNEPEQKYIEDGKYIFISRDIYTCLDPVSINKNISPNFKNEIWAGQIAVKIPNESCLAKDSTLEYKAVTMIRFRKAIGLSVKNNINQSHPKLHLVLSVLPLETMVSEINSAINLAVRFGNKFINLTHDLFYPLENFQDQTPSLQEQTIILNKQYNTVMKRSMIIPKTGLLYVDTLQLNDETGDNYSTSSSSSSSNNIMKSKDYVYEIGFEFNPRTTLGAERLFSDFLSLEEKLNISTRIMLESISPLFVTQKIVKLIQENLKVTDKQA